MNEPERLAEQLKKDIICKDGQYIRQLSTAVWMHYLQYDHFMRTGNDISGPKFNVLVLGKSGTGKTMAVKMLGKILDIPVVIEDASSLTGSGWKGRNVSSLIASCLDASGNDEHKARHAIVCLDEFDKLFTSHVADASFYPINNLLTFIGGSIVTHTEPNNNTVSMDTSNMLFVFLGAFDGLDDIIKKRLSGNSGIGFGASGYADIPKKNIFKFATKDDLHEYGLSWELLGRIPLITATDELEADDFYRILTESQSSPVKQYDDFLYKSIGAHVSISGQAARHIAQKAMDSNMGARGLAQLVSEALHPAIYDIGSDDSISAITLDFGPEGIFTKQEHNGRPNSQGQGDIYRLCDIEFDLLDSVPFVCIRKRSDIWLYAETIKQSARQAAMLPPEYASAAVCILAAAICSQLMDNSGKNPTMILLYKTIDIMSPDSAKGSVYPLAEIYDEFLTKAKGYAPDFGQAQKMAKQMVLDYCRFYNEQPDQPFT